MTDLEDLQAPDARTLPFVPGGLGVGVQMLPEGSAEYWRQVADRFVLHDDVALQTRRVFADLVAAFPYGVLRYEIFTLVHDRALFALEQALRDRLSDYGRIRKDELLGSMIKRARDLGLLAGQRTKVAEDAIRRLRNDIAHSGGYHLLTPVDAARTLSDLTEIINRLWGRNTEGGRLYPAPMPRHSVALAWNPGMRSSASSLATDLADPAGWEEYTQFALVQAPWPAEADLHCYDSWFETVIHPVDYLWGPGSRVEALAWLDEYLPTSDAVDVLGRPFAVRADGGRLWWPMRPEIAAGLSAELRCGHWYLVEADVPAGAFIHVRNVLTGGTPCNLAPVCPGCGARSLGDGDLEVALATADREAGASVMPPDFRLPGLTLRRWYDVHSTP